MRFVIHFGFDRSVAEVKPTSSGHYISQSPGVHLPPFLSFISVGLEQIVIWLEIRECVNIAFEEAPAQIQNHKGEEFHNVEGWAHCALSVFEDYWSDGSLGEEGSFLELNQACSIGCTSLSENQEWRVFASFFNQLLSVSDCG